MQIEGRDAACTRKELMGQQALCWVYLGLLMPGCFFVPAENKLVHAICRGVNESKYSSSSFLGDSTIRDSVVFLACRVRRGVMYTSCVFPGKRRVRQWKVREVSRSSVQST